MNNSFKLEISPDSKFLAEGRMSNKNRKDSKILYSSRASGSYEIIKACRLNSSLRLKWSLLPSGAHEFH